MDGHERPMTRKNWAEVAKLQQPRARNQKIQVWPSTTPATFGKRRPGAGEKLGATGLVQSEAAALKTHARFWRTRPRKWAQLDPASRPSGLSL